MEQAMGENVRVSFMIECVYLVGVLKNNAFISNGVGTLHEVVRFRVNTHKLYSKIIINSVLVQIILCKMNNAQGIKVEKLCPLKVQINLLTSFIEHINLKR
jgi:hypothetical protein